MNYPISTVQLSLLKTEPKPRATNEEELEKLHSLIELQKSKGHKYPLLACVFLLFRTAGKKTLTKTEMYDLMEKKAIEDKTKIVSSPTERYCVITQNNFKSKIKDIVKKKKWFTRAINDKGEIIYTLNDGVVCQISPKIESYLNIIEKRDGIFKNKAREEVENIEKPQEKKRKRNPKIKKIFKKYTPNNNIENKNANNIQQNTPNNNMINNNNEIKKEIEKNNNNKIFVVNNNINNPNSINTLNTNSLNTLNSENTLINASSNMNTNMNMEIEDNKDENIKNNNDKSKIINDNKDINNNNNININNEAKNDIITNNENKNNENNINTANINNANVNNTNINNIEKNNNEKDSLDSSIINTDKKDINNNEENKEHKENKEQKENNNDITQIKSNEAIIKANSTNTKVCTNNFLIQPKFINHNDTSKKNPSKSIHNLSNNKKKKKVNKEKKDLKKIIRQSRSLSNVIEIKDNSDDFDIIIEDEREKNYINNNIKNINTFSNNLSEEARNLNNEIEAILSGKKEINKTLMNTINNKDNKKNQNKKGNKNKKIKKNAIEELELDYTEENIDESEEEQEENKVIDLTNQRRVSLNYRHQNTTPTPTITPGIISKNKIKNSNKISNKQNNKVKHLLNNKRKSTNTLSPFNKSSISFYNNNNNNNSNNKFKKKRPLEEKNFASSDNDLYEEKKPAKKKEVKKNNTLGTKMSSILSMGELLLNLINKGELSQLMNKKIVYFKQKIEKKEKEIRENKKLIEDLIHSCEKIKSIKNKDILDLINDLKSYYKIFKDKIEILYGYKSALEKMDKAEKNYITEDISNYKQVYIECNQILIKMVNIINTMVKEYGSLDEFVSILCLEEKDTWAKQNIGLNSYDFRKKIKNARNVDDIAELFKQELDKAKIDVNLFNKYDKSSKPQKINNDEIIIELNKYSKNSKEKLIRIDDKKVKRINDNNNNNNSRRNKKNNLNDSNNKENINLTNDNNSEENTKINKNDKIESVDTNNQSVESLNNINNNDNNGNVSINIP